MNAPDPERLLDALATQIRPTLTPDTHIVGIHTGGFWVASRLHAALKLATPLGGLATTLHRDDFGRIGLHPQKKATDIAFDVNDATIILVDDVLYTGRTVRAALNELYDFGRPRCVRLACLLDRGGRQLPIAPDFTGASMPLAENQQFVLSQSTDGRLLLALEQRT